MNPSKQLIQTAYHEAGHAVISYELGFNVKRVTIVPGEDSLGHMKPRGYLQLHRLEGKIPTGEQLGRYHDRIVILLAGTEAQRRYNPRSVRNLHRHLPGSDYQRVNELLMHLHGEDEGRAAFRYLKIRARNFVSHETNWVRIEGLANALLESQTLSGDEMEKVCAASIDAHYGLPPLTRQSFA